MSDLTVPHSDSEPWSVGPSVEFVCGRSPRDELADQLLDLQSDIWNMEYDQARLQRESATLRTNLRRHRNLRDRLARDARALSTHTSPATDTTRR